MATLLNQTQRWMKHPITWRFMGLASTIIGLLCYALSSSFNSLFGEWNLLKTFLYCVFSFIICTAVLFAKLWQRSSSLRLKAHMAFLVLTITSFYSFFFDKAVNKKPDAYSVVSCAGFAVMWLSLSSQTHCAFEVDLFYFFLGTLIVQLMKINWLLGIAGAGFSYSLIILRSCLDTLPEANGYSELQDQPQVVIQVGSLQSQSSTQQGNTQGNADMNLFKPKLLDAIKALKEKNLLLIRELIRTLGKSFQPDCNLFIDTLPSEIINNLNEAMKLTVAAGFEEECCQLYSSCRKEFLRQCLSELNLKIFIDNEYESAGTTAESIQSWIRAFEVAVQIVFPNERRLCDRVFFGLSSIGDLSFVQICKEPAIRLLNLPKTFVVEISWPMNFKEVLEVLKTLLEIIPELESLFPDQEAVSLKNAAIMTRKRLGEAIRDIFKGIEVLIRCDTRIADVPGGIYPIARDVVNRLREVTKCRIIIECVWNEYSLCPNIGGTYPSFDKKRSRIWELLEHHLKSRSKNYKEPALCCVSMLNNSMFINQEKKRHDPFYTHFRFTSKQVQQILEDYQRSSWSEVLGLKLDKEEEESVAPGLVGESMKEKLQWMRLDEAIGNIFKDLENLIHCDKRIADVPGSIYPITRDIMDQLHGFIDIKTEIELYWEKYHVRFGRKLPFFVHVASILELLESHLEARSKNYTEPGVCYVSMMNNLMYMKQEMMRQTIKIERSLQKDQIQKLTSKVQQNLEDYQRISWNEVLSLLELDNEEESVAPGLEAKVSMEEKLQLFNIQFEQICTIQSQWFANDDTRKEIIKSLENVLLRKYGNFIGRFYDVLGKHASEYIQFGMSDITARLNGTFRGGKRVISLQKWRKDY